MALLGGSSRFTWRRTEILRLHAGIETHVGGVSLPSNNDIELVGWDLVSMSNMRSVAARIWVTAPVSFGANICAQWFAIKPFEVMR